MNDQREANWLVSREAVEKIAGQPVSEENWAAITDEIAGRVDNFIEEIIEAIVEDKVSR